MHARLAPNTRSTTLHQEARGFQSSRETTLAPNSPTWLKKADPSTQPSEPILFPKLRIYFADFPYLHYSID